MPIWKFNVTLLICCLLVLSGCDRDDDDMAIDRTGDYFIFGHFYGLCGGDGCIQLYKIENGQFYEDSLDLYPNSDNGAETAFFALDTVYNQFLSLPEDAPDALFEETETVIGMPDAYDQGGIYLEWKTDEQRIFFLIDRDPDNLPDYLKSYLNSIQSAILTIWQ